MRYAAGQTGLHDDNSRRAKLVDWATFKQLAPSKRKRVDISGADDGLGSYGYWQDQKRKKHTGSRQKADERTLGQKQAHHLLDLVHKGRYRERPREKYPAGLGGKPAHVMGESVAEYRRRKLRAQGFAYE